MGSDTIPLAVEQRHGWLIPPAWEFDSEVWVCTRRRVDAVSYDHEGEVQIIR